ncbi:LOW QUALITY PROTEIN: ice-structuring glycoprotein [Cyclospora cayetanensis]|uniref:LOW QUALITY PROTEIN: ice-structuring glycoprotein n=1 Tax=Cyclospora cayetanensis TaxID=88456 RepID=A0A6P6RVL9_9EIME|nr:LOW QUALITY PROTEIN: ice-structuring glycoprotein [Cyclospora cayetanensis]
MWRLQTAKRHWAAAFPQQAARGGSNIAVQLRLPAGESDSPGEEGSPVSQQEQLGGSQHMQVAAAATSHSTDTAEAGAAATSHSTDTAEAGAAATSHSTDTAEARAAATRHSTDTAEARAAATRHSTDTAEARAAATRLSTDTAEAGAAAGEKPTEALASMTAAAGSASAGASAALSSNKVSSGNNNHRYKTTKRQSETSPFALSTWLQGVAAAVDGEPEDGELPPDVAMEAADATAEAPAEVAAEVTPAGGSVAHCGSTSAAFAAADTPRVASKADSSTTSLLQLLHHTSQWPYAALANPPTLTAASSEQRCGSSLTGEFTKPPGLLLEPDTPGSSRIPAGKSGGRLSFRLQKSPVDALHLRRCKPQHQQQHQQQQQQQQQQADPAAATTAGASALALSAAAPAPAAAPAAAAAAAAERKLLEKRSSSRRSSGDSSSSRSKSSRSESGRAAVKVAPAIQGARAAAASGDSRDAVSIAMLSFEEAAAALRGAKRQTKEESSQGTAETGSAQAHSLPAATTAPAAGRTPGRRTDGRGFCSISSSRASDVCTNPGAVALIAGEPATAARGVSVGAAAAARLSRSYEEPVSSETADIVGRPAASVCSAGPSAAAMTAGGTNDGGCTASRPLAILSEAPVKAEEPSAPPPVTAVSASAASPKQLENSCWLPLLPAAPTQTAAADASTEVDEMLAYFDALQAAGLVPKHPEQANEEATGAVAGGFSSKSAFIAVDTLEGVATSGKWEKCSSVESQTESRAEAPALLLLQAASQAPTAMRAADGSSSEATALELPASVLDAAVLDDATPAGPKAHRDTTHEAEALSAGDAVARASKQDASTTDGSNHTSAGVTSCIDYNDCISKGAGSTNKTEDTLLLSACLEAPAAKPTGFLRMLRGLKERVNRF